MANADLEKARFLLKPTRADSLRAPSDRDYIERLAGALSHILSYLEERERESEG